MSGDPARALEQLLCFLEQDPRNQSLLDDAASAAFAAGDDERVLDLARRAEAGELESDRMANIAALALLRTGRSEEAVNRLRSLVERHPYDQELSLNLAYAETASGDIAAADALLEDELLARLPRARALKIRSLHRLGHLDEAVDRGRAWLADADPDLAAAIGTAALDAGELDLAANASAKSGPGSTDGIAVKGTLLLAQDKTDEAIAAFDRALALNRDNARGHLGRGLALLKVDDFGGAAKALDRAAELFGSHPGSWIAAGWCHAISGNIDAARDRFERAVVADPTFAEAQGSLAALEVMAGDFAGGEDRTRVATRLDRQSFAAALARSLLLAREGRTDEAQRVRALAMNQPVGPDQRTLADLLREVRSRTR